MTTSRYFVTGFCALALAACSASDDVETVETDGQESATETVTETVTETSETVETRGVAMLDEAVAGDWRRGRVARDDFRNPQATLEFMQVDPSSTVLEIWPGGGWYTDILAPWIAGNEGTYIAAHFPATSENRQRSRDGFQARFADTAVFGDIVMADFDGRSGPLAEAGSVDTILSFRNVHNWMMGNFAEKAFDDFFAALRPGGTLGIVEHRLPSTREQDPRASSGYVQQAYVIALAEEAGFELVDTSEINANPADTADHPFGVWTLPPVGRSAPRGEEPNPDFDRASYDAIGESDRMTLLFRKPENTEAESAE